MIMLPLILGAAAGLVTVAGQFLQYQDRQRTLAIQKSNEEAHALNQAYLSQPHFVGDLYRSDLHRSLPYEYQSSSSLYNLYGLKSLATATHVASSLV